MDQHEQMLKDISAKWTEADWEHHRLLGQAIRLEFQRIRLAQLVKKSRKAHGYSQRQLAHLTGIQQKEICKIEKQKGNPTFETLNKLFLVLGIYPNYSMEPIADSRPAAA
ncbi:MAG: helix-turn-helix domain-containing protein [Micrococcales bacterium]